MRTGLLSPEGIHVGDDLGAETVIAYVDYTDDCQAVITLIPKDERLPYPDPKGGNYRTFFLHADGSQHDSKCHWNIIEATHRYEEEMGGDI